MKTLYLDCKMGVAGDMLTAALLELLPNPDAFIEKLNDLGIPKVHFQKEVSVKCGIKGTHVTVTVDGKEEECCEYHHESEHQRHAHSHQHCHVHSHRGLEEIEHIVREHMSLSRRVQDDVMAVYQLIANAESHVHGVPVTEVHFHEVGMMDAIADIAAVCLLMEALSPDEVVVSPVHVGSGQIKCAHGILPVPAPATAHILKDAPIYGSHIKGELCTPTGAALVKHFATRFDSMPMMKIETIGYGMGKKDFEEANCVRAMYGETQDVKSEVCELSCNLDDMTGEAIGFAMEQLLADGALDVYTVPIGMKKSRPGVLLHVMCREADKEQMIQSIFKHTTTIGVREAMYRRYTLSRYMETMETPRGNVRCKVSSGYGVERRKYEYDDLAQIAKANGMSIFEVQKIIETQKG